MLLRKTYSINAGISKEESSSFVGGGGGANEIESKQREENTKYETMRREIDKNQKQGVGICFCF